MKEIIKNISEQHGEQNEGHSIQKKDKQKKTNIYVDKEK